MPTELLRDRDSRGRGIRVLSKRKTEMSNRVIPGANAKSGNARIRENGVTSRSIELSRHVGENREKSAGRKLINARPPPKRTFSFADLEPRRNGPRFSRKDRCLPYLLSRMGPWSRFRHRSRLISFIVIRLEGDALAEIQMTKISLETRATGTALIY